ncbi:MAG: hypothetical protein AUREO_012620 [Aureobasidium pullulans]|nr:MAG: Uncharacterized protein AUREO_045790 [Aureobasidium pullulans]OBW68676.1 MAG: hypothetical protein AUREO_012620 [Aureobasidium pullulans]THY63937.1 hypothetical protein D6C99_00403 [Aureobasidium pullulans]
MSVNRSNSQVRNLLAMFENNNNNNHTSTDSTSPDRGRSNGHLSPSSNGDRPLSKVRSSFVSVEHGIPTSPSPAMEIDPQKTKEEYQSRQESSASLRRHSFSLDESKDGNALANLRQSMSQEEERRGSNPMVAETIPEAAIEQTPAATTPAVEAKDYMAAGHVAHGNGDLPQSKLRDEVSADDMAENGDASPSTDGDKPQAMTLPVDDMPADNPDKPVSGVQEEAGSMQPSDLKERSTVSPTPSANGEPETAPAPPAALPSRARRGTVTAVDASPAPVPHRPANIVATAPEPEAEASPKTPTSVKKAPAPTSVKKSPAAKSSTLSPKPPVRKPSNSSLTQAKTKSDAASAKTKSPQSKPTRPRSPTRPIKVSSHLTAPTAASAARQDNQSSKPSVSVSKPAVNSRPQPRAPAAATKPTARSSIASTSNPPKKTESKPAISSKGTDDSFLARMMRPTASSASKAHEKTEAKSPPKRTPSVIRSKIAPKAKTGKAEKTKSSTSIEKADGAAGASTPQAADSDQGQENSSLEATPAFEAATIR